MKVIFAGTPQFAADALAALLSEYQVTAVLTQPDRPSGRGMRHNPSPVKQLAVQHGVLVMQPTTLKSEQVQREIASLHADVIVVAAYGLILPKAVLQLPRYGCLNIHASLLPRWRGAAPIQRAILAGDDETGITIMQMDEGLDTGDILLRNVCPIALGDTAATLHDKLADLGASSILQALRLLQKQSLTPIKQEENAATYATKLIKSEGQIDWRQEAREIERAVRAFNPFPVCNATYGDVSIKVWQVGLVRQQGEPGEVLAVDKQGVTVACGKDALRLKMLQRPGGKVQPAGQFLQAMPIKCGDKFFVN